MQIYRRFSDLKKFHLKAQDGEIGKPDEFYFDDKYWAVRYLIVHTGSWLSGREVLIAPGIINDVDDQDKTVGVDLTRQQVEKSPPVEAAKPVSRYYEEKYHRYHGWQSYWSGNFFSIPKVQPVVSPMPEELEKSDKPPDSHLRSSKAVTGYRLHTVDGEIGTVKDFILGDKDWRIRYLEVDIGPLLIGRKVVVEPTWITAVDWQHKEVSVKLSREAIKSAPKYRPGRVISKEFELKVYKHYSARIGNIQEGKK